MSSIRIRLFVILLLATGVVWLSAFLWIQQSTLTEVERVLDARLAESGQMVSSLISDRRVDVAAVAKQVPNLTAAQDDASVGYSHKLSCQIWSLDGELVGRSGSAPTNSLAGVAPGFSSNIVDGEEWRVHTVINEALGVRVMVGDSQRVRDRLVQDVTMGLVLPALTILPVLAGLIWLAVWRGLRPLDRLAEGLSQRSADDLRAVEVGPLPREIRPVGRAINGLFGRVDAAREREKAFTSFAAHELKTPLAGIKTQAQVAMMATDDATRTSALAHIQHGVDRTDRMVRQLLSLASVDGTEVRQDVTLDAGVIIRDVVDDLARVARGKGITVTAPGNQKIPLNSDPVLLTVALRNVVENAIAVAPDGSDVDITAETSDEHLKISVLDRGPGIADEDRAKIADRFFRGAGSNANGSGLGLAIVEAAVHRLGGEVAFAPRPGGGEIVSMIF
ncbi:ATP-binding protein [uncultured Aliiroseovarius sp.]|uniref:ATP-binding protein n=1 Tax=uncultured Aliiroseovarius sp. TaxID=1658783 RepID=UPI002592261B|nr:ATP-binding protein [uncultured Aliiroseovarius sp.]